MSLSEQIHQDLISAMKAKDEGVRDVLRLVENSIKKKQIELKDRESDLGDDAVITLISGQIKQRKDSIEQYEKAGRTDLSDKEKKELDILVKYLPEQMSETEIEACIREVVEKTGATSMKDMGKVMGPVMGKVKGRADGNIVKTILEKVLNS